MNEITHETNLTDGQEEEDIKIPAHILIVDDEPAHRDSLQRIFLRAGYLVEVAEDGARAVELIQKRRDENQEPFDIVLTDLVMPRVDGMALLRAVRTVMGNGGSDVVMMTAYGAVDHAVDAMRAGAQDFLVKPVKRSELLLRIERVLERRRLSRENDLLVSKLRSGKHLPKHISAHADENMGSQTGTHTGNTDSTSPVVFSVGTTLAQIEKEALQTTLAYTNGDKVLAAKLLGISLRTLYRRLDENKEEHRDEK